MFYGTTSVGLSPRKPRVEVCGRHGLLPSAVWVYGWRMSLPPRPVLGNIPPNVAQYSCATMTWEGGWWRWPSFSCSTDGTDASFYFYLFLPSASCSVKTSQSQVSFSCVLMVWLFGSDIIVHCVQRVCCLFEVVQAVIFCEDSLSLLSPFWQTKLFLVTVTGVLVLMLWFLQTWWNGFDGASYQTYQSSETTYSSHYVFE